MDCFYLAFKVPNLLRDLFAEGALSQAFVTTFSKKLKADGEVAAWALANKMLTLAAVFMSGVTLLGIWLAPWIVAALTSLSQSGAAPRNYAPDEIALTVDMVRIMYPFIALVSLSALVMGMLNARNVFGMPALSSCFFNLGSMISGGLIGWWMDPTWGKDSLLGFSIGVVIGGLAQLSCQFPALMRVGYRFVADFRWADSGVRQVLRLMGPAVIASSVVQIQVLINAIFAYGVGEGAVSWLSYAFRLMQLPIGVFGVAVATVALPALSRAAVSGIGDEFRMTLNQGLSRVAFWVLPSMLGLCLLAGPIVSVLYERGAFDANDRLQTAAALRAYSYGLLCYAWLKVIQPAFYAIEKRWLPMVVSILALLANVVCNGFFVFVLKWGHESLALTTSISASINLLILYVAMRRIVGDFGSAELVRLMTRLGLCALAMAGLCWIAERQFFSDPVNLPWLLRCAALGLTVLVAGSVYLGSAWILGVKEAREMAGWIKNLTTRRE